jgi:predicted regulator of Ras-like GTPase activity (Roadblock/LC7/MglB family)
MDGQAIHSVLARRAEEQQVRDDHLSSILSNLNGSSADIEASAVISRSGLMMAALLPQGLDSDRVGAMSAALLSLGERTLAELTRGDLDQVMVKGSGGYVMLAQAGPEAVLTVLASPDARLGLVFLDVGRAAEDLAQVI